MQTKIEYEEISNIMEGIHSILSNESNISKGKDEEKEKEKTGPYNIKSGDDPSFNKIMKQESVDFSCPKCGNRLFENNLSKSLEKWISREINGIKKIIF